MQGRAASDPQGKKHVRRGRGGGWGAASLLLTAGEGEARAPITLIGTTVLVGEARTRTGPMSISRDRLE